MRRVEIAKGLLHRPRLFLLDEPSTGLDPAARQDLWDHLRDLRRRDGVTIVMTTHLMEEAEACDQLAILSQGRLVASGTPRQLKDEIGGDVIVLTAADAGSLRAEVERVAGTPVRLVDGTLRLECAAGHRLIPRLAEAFPGRFESINLGRPTLLDVFVRRTGLRFETGDPTPTPTRGRR
jgi:ABC-2 type transport system ATP-binding protein